MCILFIINLFYLLFILLYFTGTVYIVYLYLGISSI